VAVEKIRKETGTGTAKLQHHTPQTLPPSVEQQSWRAVVPRPRPQLVSQRSPTFYPQPCTENRPVLSPSSVNIPATSEGSARPLSAGELM
jgi:hypothetical protein